MWLGGEAFKRWMTRHGYDMVFSVCVCVGGRGGAPLKAVEAETTLSSGSTDDLSTEAVPRWHVCAVTCGCACVPFMCVCAWCMCVFHLPHANTRSCTPTRNCQESKQTKQNGSLEKELKYAKVAVTASVCFAYAFSVEQAAGGLRCPRGKLCAAAVRERQRGQRPRGWE